MEQYITLVLFGVASAGLLAAAHYVWQEREIQAPQTYVIGVGTIQGTLILWMLYRQVDPFIIFGVIVITAAIGGAIQLCYLIDKAKRADRARPYVEDKQPDRG